MNPLPSEGGIPTHTIFVDGYLEVIMLVSIASILVVFVMMLWNARTKRERRERLFCPDRQRKATVVLRVRATGRTDVLRCSVFGNRPVTCGKTCVQRQTA